MTVLNFQIKNISGEKTGKTGKNIQVNANSNIVSVKKDYDKRIGDYVEVEFKYEIDYEPDIGSIKIKGSLWYASDKLDSLVSVKKENVELKKEAVTEITNSVLQDSLIEAITLSRRLQLPPPIKLPKVNVKPEKLTFPKGKAS